MPQFFQCSLNVNKIDVDEVGPHIVDVQLPAEPYRGGISISFEEFFDSGFVDKLQTDCPPAYWPQMIAKVLHEDDLMKGFAILQRIMRKEIRKNGRIPHDMLCEIMRSINPDDAQDQLEHCINCATCRFIAGSFDYHSFKFELETLAADFFIATLIQGLTNAKNGLYHMNNCPFINKDNCIDEENGFAWIAPGSGSHSIFPRHGKMVFASRAGIRLGETFVIMNTAAKGNFVAGEYHVNRRNE